jgi:hypothetical protein
MCYAAKDGARLGMARQGSVEARRGKAGQRKRAFGRSAGAL